MCVCYTRTLKALNISSLAIVPDNPNLLIPDEVKEFGSSLEVTGRKERAHSLSSINILISPCSGDPPRPPQNRCAGAPTQMDASVDKTEKVRLEAAASFPLVRSSSPTDSALALHRKSVGGIFCSPAHQVTATTVTPFVDSSGSHCRVQPAAEDNQGAATTFSGTDNGHNRHSDKVEEEFLVGEDQMYPTLRSKSLNENPRKVKRKERDEVLHSSASVKDLVSAFGGITEVLQSRTESRVSGRGTP